MDRPAYPRWPIIDEEDYAAAKSVLDARALWCGAPAAPCGQNVWKFQEEFAAFQGARHCIAITNGTHAIEASLRALGIGVGDEVIVTDYTFFASASAVLAVNAVPILCDIRADTHNMDPGRIESLVTERTKAIVAVHLGGMPCDMDAILRIARKHRLRVVEDCAHAHGSKYRGKRVGNHGDCGTFSFQASKLIASGEGGAIICNDDALADEIYGVVDSGRRKGAYFYAHHGYGSNCRLGEFQAAVLRTQLRKFATGQHERRQRSAAFLRRAIDAIDGFRCQAKIDGVEEVGNYVFPVSFDPEKLGGLSKETIVKKIEASGIPTDDCYPPIHSLVCFREVRCIRGIDYSRANWGGAKSDDRHFPVTSHVYRHSFQLPQELLLAERESDLAWVATVLEGIRSGKN
jgi:dTDP-4-amino-4,6-dideoxygalactose transaminase